MKPSSYSMWDPNAWTAGMSKEPRKPNLKPYFSDTAAKDRVPDVAKRKVGFEPFQISKIDRDQDSKKEKPKAISRVHTVPNDNHINDLSYAISQMLGHDKVERTKTMGYVVTQPKTTANRPPPPSFIGDYKKFGEKFQETAEEKFGWDTFRKHQTPPDFVVKEFGASNSKQALEHVWPKTRKNLGFEGDCRFPWEKVNDMSLAELITATMDGGIALPEQSEIMNAIKDVTALKVSDDILDGHRQSLAQAQKRINNLRPDNIKTAATILDHTDLTPIRNWGQDIDLARVESLRTIKDNTIKTAIHTDTKLGDTNAELGKLLKTKVPTGLSGAFFRAKKSMGFYRNVPSPIDQDLGEPIKITDYRAMNDDQRKQYEERLVEQLEDVMRDAMQTEEGRIVYAEEVSQIVLHYQQFLQTYRRELAKNRTRIMTDAKSQNGFKTSADENAIISRDKVGRIEEAIDDRLAALDESIVICGREFSHYESLAALHEDHKKNLRMAVNHSIEQLREFDRLEQRVKLTQNIELAGQYADNLAGLKLEKQLKIVTERIRDAKAAEIENLGKMKKAMDTDEILVLDHQKPIALIQLQKILAIPYFADEPEPAEIANSMEVQP